MKYLNVGLTEEEYEWVKDQPKGFVHDLIRIEMTGEVVSPETEKKVYEKVMGVGSETVVDRITKESRVKREANPFLCKECGQTKCAGRCINKNCKLKGKLQ